MKKSIPISAAVLTAESSILFSMPNLTGWEGIPLLCSCGGLAVLLGGTAYFLFSKLAEWKEEQNQNFQEKSDSQLTKFSEMIEKMQSSHESQIKMTTELFTSKITEMQEQITQYTAHSDKIQTAAQKLYHAGEQKQNEITELFTSKISEVQEQIAEYTTNMNEIQKNVNALFQTGIQQLQESQQVQSETITETNQKINKLAEIVMQTENQIHQIDDSLIGVLSSIRSSIEENMENFKEQQEEYHEDMESTMEKELDELKKVMEGKLKEYNAAFENITENIQKVLAEIHQNTEQYQSTLSEILKAQNAMNSLTAQDIHILENILK